jgi:hypothetical protein
MSDILIQPKYILDIEEFYTNTPSSFLLKETRMIPKYIMEVVLNVDEAPPTTVYSTGEFYTAPIKEFSVDMRSSKSLVTIDFVNEDAVTIPTSLAAMFTGPKGDKGDSPPPPDVVFITGVVPTSSGIVGNKLYEDTVPHSKVVKEFTSDTNLVTVTVELNGNTKTYSPTVTINGVNATVEETSTIRWFTATAEIDISNTDTITVVTNSGAVANCKANLATVGPRIISAVLGSYPNSQTSLKQGDIIKATITTEPSATKITLLGIGAASSPIDFNVVNGTAVVYLVVGSTTVSSLFTLKASNQLGTYGNEFNTVVVDIDQNKPVIDSIVTNYISGTAAAKSGDAITVTSNVTDFSSIEYLINGGTTPYSNMYELSKQVTITSSSYVDSGTNYAITATKSSNGSSTTKSGLVKISSTSPTAVLSISHTGRLISSEVGINYTVTINSTQRLFIAPMLNASIGTWTGNWAGSGKIWTRSLAINDSMSKGSAYFSSISLQNEALLIGSTIDGSSTYSVGGFTTRVITFPAFSRVAPIGTIVTNISKTSCQLVGGGMLALQSNNNNVEGGYYIANSDGSYNQYGAYLGVSDTAFVGSNTSGTLQLSIGEAA